MTIRLLITAVGGALVFLASAVLAFGRHADQALLTLFVGIGCLALGVLPERTRSSRTLSKLLVAITLLVFTATQAIRLAISHDTDFADAVALVAEVIILGVVLLVVRAQLHGFGRVITLLDESTSRAGYAQLLSLEEATRAVEAEIARSRRRDEPLISLALDGRTASVASTETGGGLSAHPMHFLEELYLHVRLAELIAQHARRSDVVVRASRGTCFVVSPGTDVHGALSLADRVVRAARADLGVTVQFGLASFPGDGETLSDLMSVASERSRAGSDGTSLSAVASAQPPDRVQAIGQ
jgi:hypothetical protein